MITDLLKNNKNKKGILMIKDIIPLTGKNLSRRMILSQIFYWHSEDTKNNCRLKVIKDGQYWLAKSIEDLANECDMNKRSVETALKYLAEKEIITKKQMRFGNKNILHIKLNKEKIDQILMKGDSKKCRLKSTKSVDSSHTKSVDSSHTKSVDSYKTENTTENTTEITNSTNVELLILSKDKINDFFDKPEEKQQWFCALPDNFDNIGDCQKVLNLWNKLAKNYRYITKHKSIMSSVNAGKNESKTRTNYPLQNYILKKLDTYTTEDLLNTINNYFKVIESDDYYYNYEFKTLAYFLESKSFESFLTKNKPFQHYKLKKSNDNPYLDKLDEVRFIAHKIDRKKAWDRDKKTYMSVPMDICMNRNIDNYVNDIKHSIKFNCLIPSEFIWLEECIIALIYRKKDMMLLEELMTMHDNYRRIIHKDNKSFFENYINREK